MDESALTVDWLHANLSADTAPDLTDACLAAVRDWQKDPQGTLATLWNPIIAQLAYFGELELVERACHFVLANHPGEPYFLITLVNVLDRLGRRGEARLALNNLTGGGPIRYEFLRLALQISTSNDDRVKLLSEFAAMLLEDTYWAERYHEHFIDLLISEGFTREAMQFFNNWLLKFAGNPNLVLTLDATTSMGASALKLGDAQIARQILAQSGQWLNAHADQLVGTYPSKLAPYTDALERELLTRIELAFKIPDDQLARVDLDNMEARSTIRTGLFVSYEDDTLQNDLPIHFRYSAARSNVNLSLHLDTALTYPAQFKGTMSEIDARKARFIERLANLRPDFVMLDCVPPISNHALCPDWLTKLKTQFGFKLICVLRDANRELVSFISTWARIADRVLVFDPLSPALDSQLRECSSISRLIPVPALHDLFDGGGAHDQGLVFIGATGWKPRLPILAVLLTEKIRFQGIIGAQRQERAAKMADYAEVLRAAGGVLNFSRHGQGIHLVTGRVWEAIASGALLIEQDNPATARFFTPYRHYLPWGNVEDIVHLAHFIDRRPDIARTISEAANDWAHRHYSVDKVWNSILG